ncbi:MAG: GntR family transcriptional regulator [Lachnospiraceae bacterium]|nr:GntR family transcriptional regulator [Lachnospiraceae bacterium]
MIVLDYKDRRPLYEQVAERFQELIVKGILPKDMQMPSVRTQAMQLSINPNTIQRAYSELERQGYIYSIKGKGSFVADINGLLDVRRREWATQMKALAEEGYSIGITRQEMELIIQKAEPPSETAGTDRNDEGGINCD